MDYDVDVGLIRLHRVRDPRHVFRGATTTKFLLTRRSPTAHCDCAMCITVASSFLWTPLAAWALYFPGRSPVE